MTISASTPNRKIVFFILGFCLLLLGSSCNPQEEPSPSISLTNTHFPKPSEIYKIKLTSSITPTESLKKSECSSFDVETKLPKPNLPKNYIGKTFDTLKLPSGLEFVFGSLISHSNYALIQVIISENDAHLLWLSEIKCRNDNIQDVLVLPTLKSNDALVIRNCQLNGQDDPEILAIGEFVSGVIPLTKIEYVWRANRETQKFETLPSDNIECRRDIGINSP